jgi:hypothetical protein
MEALLSRHNQRMLKMESCAAGHFKVSMPALDVVPLLDLCLMGGADYLNIPGTEREGVDLNVWATHLRTCVDELTQVTRLLLSSQVVGAALVARTMLERTTANRAVTFGVDKLPEEDSVSWMSRVWSLDDRTKSRAGHVWSELSEMLHGRGAIAVASRWESNGLELVTPPEVVELQRCVLEAQALAFVQIRGMVLTYSKAKGLPAVLRDCLINWPETGLWHEIERPDWLNPISPALWPVTYDTFDKHHFLEAQQAKYWAKLKGGPDVTLAAAAFGERRGRAITQARISKLAETKIFGPMKEGAVSGRIGPIIVTAEVAALSARWGFGPVSGALYMASTSLRSAYFLWLEDDMRAMGALRVALEHAARARTHRMKPVKSAKLEESPFANSTVRWIEACGWGRLALFARCLSELSHLNESAQWSAAMEGLRQVRGPDIHDNGSDQSMFTARGFALDLVSNLLLLEALASFESHCPDVAEALRDKLGIVAFEKDLESVLNGINVLKFPFAPSRERPNHDELVGIFGAHVSAELEEIKKRVSIAMIAEEDLSHKISIFD